jgi:hypothetical protein
MTTKCNVPEVRINRLKLCKPGLGSALDGHQAEDRGYPI